MWAIRAVLIFFVIIVVVAFAYNNSGQNQVVDVFLDPLYHDFVDVPLVTVVFWAFMAGVILSVLFFITSYVKQMVQMSNARKRVKALESELAILRNRPIEESASLLRGADERQFLSESPFEQERPR